jgi:hypothetical protein
MAQQYVDRALKSLEKLYKLHLKIPKLIADSSVRQEKGVFIYLYINMKISSNIKILLSFSAWFELWLPILSGLGQQCYHPSREIRQHSLTLLQRALLSPQLETSLSSSGTPASTPQRVAIPDNVSAESPKSAALNLSSSVFETGVNCFEDVLFPLLDELLKVEVFKLDTSGMDETRMRASALLCKIFLQYLPRLQQYKDLSSLWVKILDYMNTYIRAGGVEFLVN